MTPDATAFLEIIQTLDNPKDFTADGMPKTKPLNAALSAAGYNTMKAAERNALMEELADAAATRAEQGIATITILESRTNPTTVTIGRDRWECWVGQPIELPAIAIAALEDSDAVLAEPE